MKLAWANSEYQLVLEFSTEEMGDCNRLVTLELDLNDKLLIGEIDGHDIGG